MWGNRPTLRRGQGHWAQAPSRVPDRDQVRGVSEGNEAPSMGRGNIVKATTSRGDSRLAYSQRKGKNDAKDRVALVLMSGDTSQELWEVAATPDSMAQLEPTLLQAFPDLPLHVAPTSRSSWGRA